MAVYSVYPTLTLITFSISNYITAFIFYSLKEDVDKIIMSPTHLQSWKHRHILACQLVNCINDCFGWTLLLSISFLFLATINSTFYFLDGFDAQSSSCLEIVFSMTNLFHLLLITFSSNYVHDQVRDDFSNNEFNT